MVYIISLQSKFSPGPKKNTRTERKLPRSRPDPFSWPRTGPIPGLSKIWPRDPSRVGVARSGPGIPDGPGCPARLYVKQHVKHWFFATVVAGAGKGNFQLPDTAAVSPFYYARYLPAYYLEMCDLPETHPEVHQAFMAGEFAVQSQDQ